MKKWSSLFLGLALVLTMAAPSNAFYVNPGDRGDLLIFPAYIALDGGWESKITVINTSETYATVAKVVFRSWKNSEEILDFLIYLSPADVFTATIAYDPAIGRPVVRSADDSVLVELGTFATPAKPMVKDIVPPSDPNDNGQIGYLYVINAATWQANPSSPSLVPKSAIFNWYHRLATDANGVALFANEYPYNILGGFEEIVWQGQRASFALKPVAVANYNNLNFIDAGVETVLAGHGESSIGLSRLEDLLAKRRIMLPYYNNERGNTFHFFTFPTKISGQTQRAGYWWNLGPDRRYATADDGARTCTTVAAKIYDTTEKFSIFSPAPVTDLCDEITWIEILPDIVPFAEGWVRYDFTTVANPFYALDAGITVLRNLYPPVIPFVVNVGPNGLFALQTIWEGDAFNRYSYGDFASFGNNAVFQLNGGGVWIGWENAPGLEVTPEVSPE